MIKGLDKLSFWQRLNSFNTLKVKTLGWKSAKPRQQNDGLKLKSTDIKDLKE